MRRPRSGSIPLLGVLALVSGPLAASACGGSPYALDDRLRLTDVQAKGTHNSYHLAPKEPLHPSHDYSHAPLETQLSRFGVRQLELDIHLRDGVGFEVFHLPSIDDRSTCRTFIDCLNIIRAWSDENRWHLPLILWIEPKDEDLDHIDPTLLPIAPNVDRIDAEILSVWPRERILTPDELRGDAATIPEALARHGWPTLGALRGRVLFAMLDSGVNRAAYLAPAPNLAGRVMFVDADRPTDPFAALFKVDDARSEGAQLAELARAGFVVTTNPDEVDSPPESNHARLAASISSGAHFLSSNYPDAEDQRPYVFTLPTGGWVACNPISAWAGCTPRELE